MFLSVVGEFSVLYCYLLLLFLFIMLFGVNVLIILPPLIFVGMLDLYNFMWIELMVLPLYFMLVKSGSSFERIGS